MRLHEGRGTTRERSSVRASGSRIAGDDRRKARQGLAAGITAGVAEGYGKVLGWMKTGGS
jgi:hypothetical protein